MQGRSISSEVAVILCVKIYNCNLCVEEVKPSKMGIRFILMVNKQGQTRLAQYYEYLTLEERRALEGEIVRKCLARTEQQVSLSPDRNQN
uniref:AP complex mu/sigma subunit domain-containing protein n=1 Tax=Cannabis sativa TaxID=3483 RepID=A0A803NTZ4_CANSA